MQSAKPSFSPLKSSLANELSEALEWSERDSLALRLKQKSVFAYSHGQYFKAIASLSEAMLVAACEYFEIPNLRSYDGRQQAENKLRLKLSGRDEDTLRLICRIRNAILHGSSTGTSEVNNALANRREFQKAFDAGVQLVDKILDRRI